MIRKFADNIFLRDNNSIYIYSSAWDSFRPLKSVVWNPSKRNAEVLYGDLTIDPLDPYYGYGSEKEKDRCTFLTDKWIDHFDSAETIENIEEFWKWSHSPMTWMFDRPLAIGPCTEPSFQTWKSYPKKQRTLRKAPRTFDFRATKRRIR